MSMLDSFGINVGMISLPSGLSLIWIAFGLIIMMVGVLAYLSASKKQKEDKHVFTRRTAKEKNLPVIEVIDLAGHCESYIGEVDEKDDIMFKDSPIGLQIRPNALEGATPIEYDGVRTYSYFANMYYPTNKRNMFVLASYVDKFRELYPELDFIDDDLEISCILLSSDGEALKYNCGKILKEYEQAEYLEDEYGNPVQATETVKREMKNEEGYFLSDEKGERLYEEVEEPMYDEDGNPVYLENASLIDENELYRIIKEAKIKLGKYEVRSGFINYQRAVQLIPMSLNGVNMDRIIQITKKKMEMLSQKDEYSWLKYVGMIMIGLGIAIAVPYIVKTLFGEGGSA